MSRIPFFAFVLINFLLMSIEVSAQFNTGTVVVFSVSQQRVLVAADSRGLTDNDPPDDHVCKITNLGDQLLFTEAGVAGEKHTKLTNLNWDVNTEAVHAFSYVHRNNADPAKIIDAVMTKWVQLVKKRYVASEKTMLAELLRSATNDVLLDAVLIGRANNKMQIREASVTFDRAKAQKYGFAPVNINTQAWEIPEQPILKATGHYEVVYEFSGQSSLRSKAEARRWSSEMFHNPNADQEALKIKHLVDMSIKYSPYNWGIGGEVDEAEFSLTNGIHWLYRKSACPQRRKN